MKPRKVGVLIVSACALALALGSCAGSGFLDSLGVFEPAHVDDRFDHPQTLTPEGDVPPGQKLPDTSQKGFDLPPVAIAYPDVENIQYSAPLATGDQVIYDLVACWQANQVARRRKNEAADPWKCREPVIEYVNTKSTEEPSL